MASGGRQAHVKRVFAYDSEGTINADIWIDVLRLDKLPVAFGSSEDGAVGQIINYRLIWNDDLNNPIDYIDDSNADSQHENANPARKTHQIDVYDPLNPGDPNHVKLWIVDRFSIRIQPDVKTGTSGQIINCVFHNGDQPAPQRQTSIVTVTNNDLGGMVMSDADGGNPRIVDWLAYADALEQGNTDVGQFLTVEITNRFRFSFGPDAATGKKGQVVTFILANNKVEQFFDAGDSNAAAVQTDPLQYIVNVGFGGLAVIFGAQALDAPPFKPGGRIEAT